MHDYLTQATPRPMRGGISPWARVGQWLRIEPEYAVQLDFVRQLNRAAAFGMSLALLVGLALFPRSTAAYSAPVMLGSLVVYGCAVAVMVAGALREPERLRAVRIAGATTYLLIGVYAFWGDPVGPTHTYAPVTTPLSMGAAVFTAGVGPRRGAAAAVLLGLAVAHQRSLAVGEGQGALEGVMFLGTQLAGAALIQLLLDESRAAVAAYHSLAQSTARAQEADAALAARAVADDLVHNHVLGALLTAASARTDSERAQAGAQAAQALDLISSAARTGHVDDWRQSVADQARLLRLDVDLDVRGIPRDDTTAQALLDATTSALSNVARHSGQRRARVEAVFTPRRSTVVVSDVGVGFDLDAATPDRHGVRLGIVGRIEALGGTVDIDTAPGKGTTVTISVGRAARPLLVVEHPRLVRGLLFFGICVLVETTFLAVGLRFREAYPWWLIPLMVLTLATSLTVLWVIPATSRAWIPVATAAVVVMNLGLIVTDGVATGDWRLWFVGFFNPVFATLAFRFSPRRTSLLALAQFPTFLLVIWLAHGVWAPSQALETTAQLLLWAVIGSHLAWAFSATTERTLAVTAAIRRREDAARFAQAHAAALDDRLGGLRTRAGNLLARIAADPGALGVAAAAALTEAGLRDRLRHPVLVDTGLLDALDAARAQGSRVTLHTDDTSPAVGPVLRTAIAAVLDGARSGDEVTVTAYPHSATAQIVITHAHGKVPARPDLAGVPGVRVVEHDADVLILAVEP